ncbi:Acyl_transf_3 domain-containing protein [Caenorhabditis elegans]|uniref:Acyl_transf_3 domain-containing protein n=1 Tax=Caenorhabditis elegans TaxID=6239 RepID=A3QMD2_CAEEL|nr:Acyl_transf_3 domain-containing protein [Caenorhabditis elegans]CAM36364.1 Acyl_transf_3 domain-containing protein [Caenorhabditis elegans]|eukprot:NP_001255639.1 O-ACyltransferase homolog [Caenorhabditis elegans]
MTLSSKRQDLQGIRGLAILSVLGFHFYPTYFPNGYLGVDQFFVLSGFLMCMLLTKSETMPVISGVLHFYSRRFKRILPLYLLFIFLTVISLYTIFPDTALLQNQSSATKALLFVSNRPHTGEEDYFEKLLIAIDLFTHTWSLSVEIQFYFIVPLIFLIGSYFSRFYKYGYYFVLGTISFAFNFILPSKVSFNSLLARIWQFLIGMIIYFYSTKPRNNCISNTFLGAIEHGECEREVLIIDNVENNDNEEAVEHKKVQCNKSTYLGPFSKYCFLIPMAFVVTYPIALFPFLVRPLFTFFTGLLMLVSTDDEFLSNRVLTYIGDISYSLYLIHWPIYAYTKLTFGNDPYALAAGLIISVIVAVIAYETYEKWCLNLSNINCALLIFFLFISNFLSSNFLVNKDAIQEIKFRNTPGQLSKVSSLDGVTPNMSFDDAARLNKYWNKYDLETMIERGCVKRSPNHPSWCDFKFLNGKFNIAIFGNSYAKNHHKMFIQECSSRSYNIAMSSVNGCEPLAANTTGCIKKLDEFVQLLNSSKPDYAFLLTRFFVIANPFTDVNTENDEIYIQMKSQLKKFLPNIKKKLYILDSFPRVHGDVIPHIADDLKDGKTFEEISKALLRPDGYERGRLRHAALVQECGDKCELIDYLPLFWNNSTHLYQYFDSRGFSYFTSPNHLSAHGIELVRHIYTKICANLK